MAEKATLAIPWVVIGFFLGMLWGGALATFICLAATVWPIGGFLAVCQGVATAAGLMLWSAAALQ